LTHLAAHAFVRIDDTSIKRGFDDDGVVRAYVGAGNRMRALLAKILHDQTVPPVPKAIPSSVASRWTEVDVSVHFDSRNTWLGLAVIEFCAGQFTTPAPHTSGRIGDDNPFGLLNYDEGFATSFGERGSQSSYSDDRNPAQFQELPSGHAFVCICDPVFDHKSLPTAI
jgi:hypothetical protein